MVSKNLIQLLVVFSFVFLYFQPVGIAVASEKILVQGQQMSIAAEAGARFSVGNPDIIQVKSMRQEGQGAILLVRAKRPGISDLFIIEKSKNQQWVFRVVKKSGAIDSNSMMPLPRRLNLSERVELVRKIQKNLRDSGLSSVQVKAAGSTIWLEGILLSKNNEELALSLAKEIYEGVQNKIQRPFEANDVIRFKVRILELLRTSQKNQGFLWNQAIPNIISIHQKMVKGVFSLESTLNLLTAKGFARLLSEPTITVNSSGVAELKVGGEIPIVFRSRSTQTVLWKQYGLNLKIEVPGNTEKLVRTKLSVAVSSLDMANAVDGIPAIKMNHLDTVVDLDAGKTAFLSGLIQEEEGNNIHSLPILGDIPVLGALFRSKEFLSKKSELVIAITAQQ